MAPAARGLPQVHPRAPRSRRQARRGRLHAALAHHHGRRSLRLPVRPLGDAPPEEYREGSPRATGLLSRYGAKVRRWDPPPSDGESPETEWGLQPALVDDLASYAERHRLDLDVLRFDEPQSLSPAVADLYRSWYTERNLPADRLLVESSLLLEPRQTWRSRGSGRGPR